MQPLPATESCFVCGKSNPLGFKLRFQADGALVLTEMQFRKEHTGFTNVVHGGLISTVLDEIMVWACQRAAGKFAYCIELNVRFVLPVRPEIPVRVSAELTSNRGNRLFKAAAAIKDLDGRLLASGIGQYLAVKEKDMESMITELEWDPRIQPQPEGPPHSSGGA